MILHRLPDAYDFGVGGRVTRRVKNPGDFIGHIDGRPLLVDCKETIEKTIPVSVLKRKDEKKDTLHQYLSMLEWRRSHPHAISGYICQLGAVHHLVFCPIEAVDEIDSVSLARVGTHGIRAIDLTSGGINLRSLILGGETDGGSKS